MMGEVRLWNKIEPKPGCAVLINVPGNMHVGYVIDDSRFIHTWEESGGVTIERLSQWRGRIMGFYEYAG